MPFVANYRYDALPNDRHVQSHPCSTSDLSVFSRHDSDRHEISVGVCSGVWMSAPKGWTKTVLILFIVIGAREHLFSITRVSSLERFR